jgi:Ca2+/Na+ antiporter
MEFVFLIARIILFILLWLPMAVYLHNKRVNALLQNSEFQFENTDKLRIHFGVIVILAFSSFLVLSFFQTELADQIVIIGLSVAALVFLIYAWSDRCKNEIIETHFNDQISDSINEESTTLLDSPKLLNDKLRVIRIGGNVNEELICKLESLKIFIGTEKVINLFWKGEYRSYNTERMIFDDFENSKYSYEVKLLAFICSTHNIRIRELCIQNNIKINEVTADLNIIRREYFIGVNDKELGPILDNWLTRKDSKDVSNIQKIENCIAEFQIIEHLPVWSDFLPTF